jgi:hypothetical protein
MTEQTTKPEQDFPWVIVVILIIAIVLVIRALF